MKSRFINHLYRLRRIRGYSQKQLAFLIGLRSTRAISDFERGRRLPPLRIAMLMEIALGAMLAEIYVDLHQALGRFAVRRESQLPGRFTRHIRGRVLGKD